jgi:serine/threonine protein kinase
MRDKYLDTLPSEGQAEVAQPQSGERQCLTNDEILAFAQGRLGEAELARLHAHVDHCGTCQRLLSEAAHAVTTEPTQPGEDLAWNALFLPNTLIAQRYLIERFIARGGMGEVYEAQDCDLGERVALKTVSSTACDSPRAVRRLKAEVQMARRVSHPNVCRIYDLGAHTLERTGAVVHFLTMEFVDGQPLGQRLRAAGPLPPDQALSVARQLLQGLSTAHRAGVLHRDFKSDNVMLRKSSGAEPTPVILDFGLARSLDAEAGRLTTGQNQGLVGTLSYMAPEQIEGRPLTTGTDLYAFGVVWFEMLTGRLPFEAENAAASALERLRKEPSPPSSINPAIPPAVDEIVLRCLSRSAAGRFQSADEVLAALDSLGERTSQNIPPAATSSRPASVRSRLGARIGAAVALAVALGVVLWFTGRRATNVPVSSGDTIAFSATPLAQTGRVEPTRNPEPTAPVAPLTPAPEEPSRPRGTRTVTRPPSTGNLRAAIPVASAVLDSSRRLDPATGPLPAPGNAPHTASFAPAASTPERRAPKKMPDWENPFP